MPVLAATTPVFTQSVNTEKYLNFTKKTPLAVRESKIPDVLPLVETLLGVSSLLERIFDSTAREPQHK
jgi:hypothetical protein